MATAINIIPALNGEPAHRFIERAEVKNTDKEIDDKAFEAVLQKAHRRIYRKEYYSSDEALEVIMKGVHEVYKLKNAV